MNIKKKSLFILYVVVLATQTLNYAFSNQSEKHAFFLDVFDGKLEKVKKYLAKDIDINEPIEYSDTALIIAAEHKHYEIVKFLIEKGADVNIGNKKKWTPLFYAANTGDKKIVELLLKHGAKAEIKDSKGQTPLSRVIKYDLMKLLIDYGAEVNVFSSSGLTPLMRAARDADINFIKYLLEKGAKVNVIEKGATYHNYNPRRTAISEAVDQHRTAVVKLLLDYGADPHIPNDDNITPVMLSKRRSYNDIVKLFYDYNVLEPSKTKN